jgi:hypothetical protein
VKQHVESITKLTNGLFHADRILWKNHLKFKASSNLSKLDGELVVYSMKTCRQSNDVDCGGYILHFIDEFVEFDRADKDQVDRDIWKKPLNVKQKRKEIEETLKAGNLASKLFSELCLRKQTCFIQGTECLDPTAPISSHETSFNPLFDPKNSRFKFNGKLVNFF